jgi:hypothetical protein
MLRVTRCAITSPANPRLRIVLHPGNEAIDATSQQKSGLGYRSV